LVQIKGQVLIKEEIITTNKIDAKMGWDNLKIFFSQTTEPEELTFT
jgi:hypothetical protein